jgi:hypothetical protein
MREFEEESRLLAREGIVASIVRSPDSKTSVAGIDRHGGSDAKSIFAALSQPAEGYLNATMLVRGARVVKYADLEAELRGANAELKQLNAENYAACSKFMYPKEPDFSNMGTRWQAADLVDHFLERCDSLVSAEKLPLMQAAQERTCKGTLLKEAVNYIIDTTETEELVPIPLEQCSDLIRQRNACVEKQVPVTAKFNETAVFGPTLDSLALFWNFLGVGARSGEAIGAECQTQSRIQVLQGDWALSSGWRE